MHKYTKHFCLGICLDMCHKYSPIMKRTSYFIYHENRINCKAYFVFVAGGIGATARTTNPSTTTTWRRIPVSVRPVCPRITGTRAPFQTHASTRAPTHAWLTIGFQRSEVRASGSEVPPSTPRPRHKLTRTWNVASPARGRRNRPVWAPQWASQVDNSWLLRILNPLGQWL